MKKLLLAGILLVSGVAFSEASTKTAVEGELKVTAEVVRGLSISTTPLDFGLIPQGGRNLPNVTDGSITLVGQKGKKVLLSFYDPNNGSLEMTDSRVHLKAPTKDYWIVAGLNIENKKLNEFKDITLSSDKGDTITVTGAIEDVTGDAETGVYNGAVKIAAKYEYNTGK